MNAAERQRPPPGELYLDHLAHFVPDLGAAAAVWEKLGLKVTPLSHHQVGGKPARTSNRCVMFEEGYIELLSGAAGSGLRLACFGTPDAAAEQARLAAHGFEPEPLVNLERAIESGARARFSVVHAPPGKMDEGRVQYCEHLTPEHVWRSEFVNRDFALAAVFVTATDPVATAARWGRFAGILPHPEGNEGDLVELRCARGRVVIGTSRALSRLLGKVPPAPALGGYALSCSDPAGFAARCTASGLKVRDRAVELPAALGGAWLLESAGIEEDP